MNIWIVLILLIQTRCSITGPAACTDETIIEPVATSCLTTNFVAFSAASSDAAKCTVVTGNMLPCIKNTVQTSESVTCTEADEYTNVINFRTTITTALGGFDIVDKCLPAISCTYYTSIEYYSHRLCESQFNTYGSSSDCSDFCSLVSCYTSAASCSSNEYTTAVQNNLTAWYTYTSASQAELCCGTDDNSGSNAGLIAGIVVGVLIVIGIGVGVGVYVYMKKHPPSKTNFGLKQGKVHADRKEKDIDRSSDNVTYSTSGSVSANQPPLFNYISVEKKVLP